MITIGSHRLVCGDLTEGAVSTVMGEDRADVVYSDPPWGPRMIQYFQTKKDPGSAPRLNWPGFLDAFAQAVATYRKPNAPVFVEMGNAWVDDLVAAMHRSGLSLAKKWPVTYGSSKKPLDSTFCFFATGMSVVECEDLVVYLTLDWIAHGSHGRVVPEMALKNTVKPGMIVLDPCIGLGITASVALPLGGVIRGVELVHDRLEKTATVLRRGR